MRDLRWFEGGMGRWLRYRPIWNTSGFQNVVLHLGFIINWCPDLIFYMPLGSPEDPFILVISHRSISSQSKST